MTPTYHLDIIGPSLSKKQNVFTLLAVDAVQASLRNALIGHRITYFPVVTSTMDIAREEADQGALEGIVVVAEEQTAGRGRFGRRWLSIPGQNLSFSILLYPTRWVSARLSVAASVAVQRAIRRLCGLSPTLKWPNDVLLGGKKVCGILIEAALQNDEARHAIVGVGINVNYSPSGHRNVPSPVTSLAAELGHPVAREDVLQAVLTELGAIYSDLKGWESAWAEWQSSLDTIGREVQVRWGERVEQGFAEAVDSEGNLLLRRADGTTVTMAAGDVTLRV